MTSRRLLSAHCLSLKSFLLHISILFNTLDGEMAKTSEVQLYAYEPTHIAPAIFQPSLEYLSSFMCIKYCESCTTICLLSKILTLQSQSLQVLARYILDGLGRRCLHFRLGSAHNILISSSQHQSLHRSELPHPGRATYLCGCGIQHPRQNDALSPNARSSPSRPSRHLLRLRWRCCGESYCSWGVSESVNETGSAAYVYPCGQTHLGFSSASGCCGGSVPWIRDHDSSTLREGSHALA